MERLKTISKAIDSITERLAMIPSVLTIILMVLMTYEVVSRYFFHSPTIWSMEINQFLFCAVITLGACYTMKTGGHVSVDLIYNRLEGRGRTVLNIFGTLVIMVVLILLIKITWEGAMTSYRLQQTTGSVFNPLVYPIKALIPIGGGFFFLQCIGRILKNIALFAERKSEESEDDEKSGILIAELDEMKEVKN